MGLPGEIGGEGAVFPSATALRKASPGQTAFSGVAGDPT